jgi:hypothetical protein
MLNYHYGFYTTTCFGHYFLAIIRQYLYSPSQLSLLSPSIGQCLQFGESRIVVYNASFWL